MRCPFCGNDMRKGFVQSSGLIFFTEKPHIFLMLPNENKDEILISEDNFTHSTAEAYQCACCKKVIIDYKKVEELDY